MKTKQENRLQQAYKGYESLKLSPLLRVTTFEGEIAVPEKYMKKKKRNRINQQKKKKKKFSNLH